MGFSSWLRNLRRSDSTRRVPARKRTSFRPQLEALESRWVPSTLTVLNNLDGGAGSLRADLAVAASGDTITFAPALNGQTIKLTSGELNVTKNLTIQGPGAGQLTISGGNASRVFEVSGPGANVTLSGLTITQGNARSTSFLDQRYNGDGGGILNVSGGALTISGCTLSNNHAEWVGGGIANLGATLNVINSTLSGNVVQNYNGGFESYGKGGGVYSAADVLSGVGSQLSMTGCTLSSNHAGSEGGGVWVSYTRTTINGCTLSKNSAGSGSAIYNGSGGQYYPIVSDSLFSGNSNSSHFPIFGAWLNGGGDTFQ